MILTPEDIYDLPCWESAENLRRNILSALGRGLPQLSPESAHGRALVIAAFGPSLPEEFDYLEGLVDQGAELWCVNAAHDWLIERDVIPDACVILDPWDGFAKIITPDKRVKYYLASQCHPSCFDHFDGFDVTLWHAWVPKVTTGEDIRDIVANAAPGKHWFISGGGTAALRCFTIGKFLGFRSFDVFGLDSSFRGLIEHANPAYTEPQKQYATAHYEGKTFGSSVAMAGQAQNFEQMYLWQLNDCRVRVHGDGLIPWMCESLNRLKYGANLEAAI